MNTRSETKAAYAADLLDLALDRREEAAKEYLRKISWHERRQLQEATATLSYWISEIQNEPREDDAA